jgi:hypothetical protein
MSGLGAWRGRAVGAGGHQVSGETAAASQGTSATGTRPTATAHRGPGRATIDALAGARQRSISQAPLTITHGSTHPDVIPAHAGIHGCRE